MIPMKPFLFLLALAPTIVLASFDLVFVADEGTDLVHRFDGGSGTYLGAMQGPWLNPQSLVIDKANNTLFVGASNGIFQVGLWDGNYIAGESVGSGPGATMVGSGQYLFSLTGAGTIIGGSLAGASAWYNGANGNDGVMLRRGIDWEAGVLYQSTTSSLRRYSLPTWGSPATLLSTHTITGGGSMGGLAVGPSYVLAADGTTNKVHLMTKGGSVVNPYTYGTHSTVTGVAYAHDGIFYLVGRNTGGTSGIVTLSSDRFIGTGLRTYGTGILQNPTAVAVLAAPEPGTMLALGAGIACLLRRRRISRRSS